jgi:hypothetical protein
MLRKTTIGVVIWVTEVTLPNIMRCGGCGESTGRRVLERIKLPRTVALKKLTPGKKVLHRKTKRVKIDRAIIISSELTDRDKILNNARCNENIMSSSCWRILCGRDPIWSSLSRLLCRSVAQTGQIEECPDLILIH